MRVLMENIPLLPRAVVGQVVHSGENVLMEEARRLYRVIRWFFGVYCIHLSVHVPTFLGCAIAVAMSDM